MEEIKLKLSSELIYKAKEGNLKAIDLIKFLLSTKKAKNFRGIELEKLSLDKLLVDNRLIENARIDISEEILILTLSEKEVKPIILKDLIFDDEKLYVGNEHTLYINTYKEKVIDIKSLMEKYKEIISLCKKQSIKISYKNKTKKYLQENKELYLQEVKKDNELFEQLKEVWKCKIIVGLYSGTSEDKELENLSKIMWEKEKLHYRSEVISQVKSIKKDYEYILQELNNENNLYKVYL